MLQARPAEVRTRARKRLAVEVSGDPQGFPVFLMHGTPGSRTGPKPRVFTLVQRGLKLITYDRPGYGGSARREGRRVMDAADDVRAIADDLGLEYFAVVGRSGGGPHALACAALMPKRVTRTGLLVSLAPANAHELDWYRGMNELNSREYSAAEADDAERLSGLADWAEQTRQDPESLLGNLQPFLTHHDRRVVEDPLFRRLLKRTYREAVEQGPAGWIDDAMAFRKPWGFDVRRIPGEVRLWHGAEDQFSPVNHTRWLADHLPRGEATIVPGAGHFNAMEILPDILAWIAVGPRKPPYPNPFPPRTGWPRTDPEDQAPDSADFPRVAT
jgi:pimeloyl-ACP methyl ester carboxylesterase